MQKVSYMGDGITTEFYFNFPYFENSNIIVTKNNITATGYNIIGTSAAPDADIPYTGGKVIFDIAPTALDNITIARSLPLTRVADYQPTAKIEPTTLNQDINYLMEILKDQQDALCDLRTQYSEIADKESTTTLLARIDEIDDEITNSNQTIADFYQEIEDRKIMSTDDLQLYITNCLTNIPQDIKLELNSGTLTLKSGSKIYVPVGFEQDGVTQKFNIVTITNDLTYSGSAHNDEIILDATYDPDTMQLTSLQGNAVNSVYSGTTAPSTGLFYNTSNNTVKLYESGSATRQGCFPICKISRSTTSQGTGYVSAIDQIFNGFGYIGSTIYALPGIKGLIPNGRDTDGTLKNVEFTTTNVLNQTLSDNTFTNRALILNATTFAFSASATYDASTNKISSGSYVIIGKASASSGKISNLETKNVVCFNS